MVNYTKILFPVDIYKKNFFRIVPHVKALAEHFDAEVHLVYVAKTNEYYRDDECAVRDAKCEHGQVITRTVNEFVQKHCSALSKPKVVVLDGEPDVELLAYIKNMNIDIVMMATRGRSPVGKALLGSVAGSLAFNASVPIFLVRPDKD